MGLVRRRLQLKCRVLNAEMFGQTALKSVKDLRGVAIVEARVFHDHVGRECREIRGHTPRVQIVYIDNVRDPREVCAHVDEIEVVGRSLKKDPSRVAQKSPCGIRHECNDDE